MSFDLFVQCFESGEESSFPRSTVEEIFSPFIISRDEFGWSVCFGDTVADSTFLELDADRDLIDGFCVNHPVARLELYEALLGVLRRENLVMLVPGKCPPLVGRPETIPQMDPDVVEALGEPVVLRSAADLMERIGRS